jgi:maltooligosyltrehalose trehalohydrolase
MAHDFYTSGKEKTLIYIPTPIGASLMKEGQCVFTVWAPLRNSVSVVVGDTNKVSHPMQKDDMGYWRTIVSNVSTDTKYWYQLDDRILRPDPASRYQPDGVHGASAVVSTRFEWTDDNWKGIPLSDMIIYEIHTGTFTPPGNFQGIISRLGYLQSLGINAIEIMPIAQFAGRRNWGYDGVYHFAIQNTYGSANDLKQLVNAAHRHGIAVILDVVYNHAGPEGNYMREFGPYFTDKYKTPWGECVNFDDAWCDGVRNYVIQNALMWLDEFHFDGLRLDAVHAIRDFSARHIMEELSLQVRKLEQQTGRQKVLIAELDLNNPRYITPIEKGGYGMDGQWIDEFHHALHAVITGEINGYYEDFGGLDKLAKAYTHSYVYTGEYSPHRKKHFGVDPKNCPYSQFVVFTQNHDQVGNRLLGDRLTANLSPEALKLAAATMLLSPHVPFLFMGEEYGEQNPFLFFTDYSDQPLIEALAEGRINEFAYFNWQGEVPNPQEEAVFRQSMLSWRTDEIPGLPEFYRHLIAFRKTHPAMKNYERSSAVQHVAVCNNVLQFERHAENHILAVYLHFGQSTESLTYQSDFKIKKLFDSSDQSWNGPGNQIPCCVQAGQSITLNPLSAVVFERTTS